MKTNQFACAAAAALAAIVVGSVVRPAAQPTAAAFVAVSVLPMDRDAVLTNQTVVVRDGKIVAVTADQAAKIPEGAVRIDAKGKFLMPGLAEMHAHVPGGNAPDAAIERTLFLYAANGVTTIRGMLGDCSADVVATAVEMLLMVEIARKAGHLPLGTFDRELGRINGTQRL